MLNKSSLPDIILKHAERFAASAGSTTRAKISFIENKTPNSEQIASLLSYCQGCNHWANRGPLYLALAESYEVHMNLPPNVAVTPCANGGIALEVLARFHDVKEGRQLRWVGSAFSFSNLGRGRFADMHFVDCDQTGMLDVSQLEALDPSDYDGFVVTNIFGLWHDFAPYIAFAQKSGKAMLIDNAAGIGEKIPDWPYQSFSLHHTKTYGAGEGGFLVSPRDEAEAIYELLNYGEIDAIYRSRWLNNGKLSDIACAYHLDRLAQYPEWAPRYREQAARVCSLAQSAGLKPMFHSNRNNTGMSLPFLNSEPIAVEKIRNAETITLGKYYKPLAEKQNTSWLFERLVNIPAHPDLNAITDRQLLECLHRLATPHDTCNNA